MFASEAKAAALWTDTLQQFPPRTWWVSTAPADFTPYYALEFKMLEPAPSAAEAAAQIKALFTAAVAKRQMADREVRLGGWCWVERAGCFLRCCRCHSTNTHLHTHTHTHTPSHQIGCLLSGGLDSSLVAALCAECVEDPSMLKTFSIGLPGSPDLVAAQAVADHLGTTHYVVDVDEATMIGRSKSAGGGGGFLAIGVRPLSFFVLLSLILVYNHICFRCDDTCPTNPDAIRDTIYTLGSFDVTTVRASVGHRLVSLYVAQHTDVKVLFSGEVADEVSASCYSD